ncbi:hypothetical protein HJFPF1_02954 [Paramyrothecium foliicola]|nr:hypothetical protein HJFPF1_02954 [Paramyrothecium foliicola]
MQAADAASRRQFLKDERYMFPGFPQRGGRTPHELGGSWASSSNGNGYEPMTRLTKDQTGTHSQGHDGATSTHVG